MIEMSLGVALGCAVMGVAWLRAWRDMTLPGWLPTIGGLLIVVAARRTFLELSPKSSPEAWATLIATTGNVGAVLAGLGALSLALSLWVTWLGRARPGLLINGLLMIVGGAVWWKWAHGEAALWRASGEGFAALEAVRAEAEASMRGVLALAVTCLGFALLGVVWSVQRGGWRALGDGVAAGTLVALVLGTGQPSRDAVRHAAAPYAMRCAPVPDDAASRSAGRIPYDGRVFVRLVDGVPEQYDVTGWVDGWPSSGPLALVVRPDADKNALVEAIGARPDVLVAGASPLLGPPRMYDSHPALLASRCALHKLHEVLR